MQATIASFGSQRGAALFVALIFLVAMTLVGVVALNNNGMQTKMAYSAAETNFAFQSAETALTAGENWLETQASRPTPSCSDPCTDVVGIWPRVSVTDPTKIPVTNTQLKSDTWWASNGHKFGYSYIDGKTPAAIAGQAIPKTSQVPTYVIEDLGSDNSGSLVVGQSVTYKIYYFQITARGFGANSNANTLVQSVYAKGY